MPRQKKDLELDALEDTWEPFLTNAPSEWLGVDVGLVHPAVDSDGRIYRWSSKKRSDRKDYTLAGPVTVRKLDGGTVVRDAYNPEQMEGIAARARDVDYKLRIKTIASQVVSAAGRTDRGLVLEDWEDFRSRRKAWVDVYAKILYIAKARGVALKTVNRAYTSQTCPECGHISKGNRPDRDHFLCLDCGYKGQADMVAARNMVASQKVIQNREGVCKNPVCERPVWKAGTCCGCYFHRRRHYGSFPTKARLERLARSKSYRDFKVGLDASVPDEVGRGTYTDIGGTQRALDERYERAIGLLP